MAHLTKRYARGIAWGALALGAAFSAVRAGAAPARPLYSLQVNGIASNAYPNGETVPDNELSTRLNHSGTELVVVSKELGYSSSRWATFNGARMRETASQPIVDRYRVIIGWYREWRINVRYTSGTVLIGARPINVGRELSDRVYVR